MQNQPPERQQGNAPVTSVARAAQMIREKMEEHGMTARGWTWKFDNARRRLGQTNYKHKRFNFSIPFIEANDEAELADTVLHEFAHALAGPNANHGRLWKLVAMALGAKPEACGKAAAAPEMRYHADCPGCGKRFTRDRLPTARKGALARRAGLRGRRQRTGPLEPVETYCSPCLDRLGRKSESFEKLKLSWVETATGRAVEWPPKKAEGKAEAQAGRGQAAAPETARVTPPTPEATRGPEVWTVKPTTGATQPTLF